MSLSYLRDFNIFDLKGFLQGKDLEFVDAREWTEPKEEGSKEMDTLGTKVTVIISKDRTEYKNPKMNGNRKQTNSKEKLTIKVRRPLSDFDSWQEDDSVMIDTNNLERVTVWGKYSNELSIIGDVINLDSEDNKKSDSPKENH